MLFKASVLLSVLSVASAQYGGGAAAGTSSSTSSAAVAAPSSTAPNTQVVLVGKDTLKFTPENITAAVGSKVEFRFYPQTHSVAQSTFDSPCVPANTTAFFSGGMKTDSGVNANTFTITVNDTKPIWFYCGFPGHCESGMVGVINQAATGVKTLDAYKAAAKKVDKTVAPAQVGGGVIAALSSTTSGAPATSSSSAANREMGVVGSTGSFAVAILASAGVLVGMLLV